MISVGGAFALVFIITFFMAAYMNEYNYTAMNNFHQVAFVLLFFSGAIWIAGHAYQDMNTTEKATNQLMIPASRLEKFLVPWIFSSVFWILAISILYTLYASLLNSLWGLIFGLPFGFFDVLSLTRESDWWNLIQAYFLVHSAFFLGGLAFRTYPLGKTILSGFVVNILFTSIAAITGLILVGNNLEEFFDSDIDEKIRVYINEDTARLLEHWVKVFFTLFLPLVFYTSAYFKLKEREV